MPSLNVLHLTDCLSLGGAGRALIGLVKHSSLDGVAHSLVSLNPALAPALELAAEAGLRVLPHARNHLPDLIAQADVVQINFWNSPALYRALAEAWGPARVATWCLVSGDHAPQILPRALVDFSDALIASSRPTAELPVFKRAAETKPTATIIATPDFTRLRRVGAPRSDHFTIGYVGTVDFVKMHPDFVKMHAALTIPGVRVRVCGDGGDLEVVRRQASRTADPGRFEFLGFHESVAEVLSTCDIFGYPLAPENYATSELALQEAMYLGVPPVVLAGAGPAGMVQPGVTGLRAASPAEYVRQVERLAADPSLRRALGGQAAAFAREHWGADKSASQMNAVYRRLLEQPKVARPPCFIAHQSSGAESFVHSLGSAAPQFEVSLLAQRHPPATVAAADRLIADSTALLAGPASGGVLHYRFAYPQDPHLRFWSGLILARKGRPALAALEFQRARAGGIAPSRLAPFLGESKADGGPAVLCPPGPSAHPEPPGELTVRAGLADAIAQLRAGPREIAYLGNSITAQRDGYQPLLHQWLVHWSGQPHRNVKIGLGGVASFGAAFYLGATLKKRTPTLCFVECTMGDLGSSVPLDTIGPVVEGIVLQLRAMGCSPCFLHLYERRQHSPRGRAVLALYEEIAAFHRIPSIHLGAATEAHLRRHDLAEHGWFRDAAHTRAAAAFFLMERIGAAFCWLGESVDGAGSVTAKPLETGDGHSPAPLYPGAYRHVHIARPSPEDFPAGEGWRWDTFHLAERTLEFSPPMGLAASVSAGEIVGLLYVNGPSTGALDLGLGAEWTRHQLRDKWSRYERLHVFRFPQPILAGVVVRLKPAPAEKSTLPVDSAGAEAQPSAMLPSTLRLIGLLVRQPSAAAIRVSLSLFSA